MTEVLVEKVESNYTSNFWQGPCPNWLHLSWPPVWPTPHQTSKCMMVYHVLHVLLNLLFSTGKPRNVFLSVLRQETGFSRKDNSLTQTWVNPCWHCSWVCFDSKLDAAVLIVQWTKIWGGTIRLWTLDSSSYSNVPLTPSADENSTKLGDVHICPQHHHKTRQLLRTVWVGQKRSLKGCQRTQKSTPLTKLNSG